MRGRYSRGPLLSRYQGEKCWRLLLGELELGQATETELVNQKQ